MIGTLLSGRYRILSKLGEGGMGEVYLAEHIALQRKEALKILHPALADDPQFVQRFRREARATNRVQHPNIVSVYDFGQLPDGRFYLSVEYAEGRRLDAVLRESGALPLPRALNILHQLANAADHAHGLGVVHCDLKPENLMLVEHRGHADVLKVLDFGIAKITAADPHDNNPKVTSKGQVFGTPHYMAPEQVACEAIDARTDLYAIGCIAFELVVGQPVFSGRTMEVISQHLAARADPPSRRRTTAGVPPEFDALVARCLEKEPEKRFQDAGELRRAIERVPGYLLPRTHSSRRRFASQHRLPTFDFEDTDENEQRERKLRSGLYEDPARSPTAMAIDQGELREARQQALRELAEALLDIGHEDTQLLISVSQIKDLEDELSRNENERIQIESRTSDLEQSSRERESSLRFALGEMLFARGTHPAPELEQQIAQIEKRLARLSKDSETALTDLTDRAIALAAARAGIEERLEDLCAPLERLVEAILPAYENTPAIRPAAVAWRTLATI